MPTLDSIVNTLFAELVANLKQRIEDNKPPRVVGVRLGDKARAKKAAEAVEDAQTDAANVISKEAGKSGVMLTGSSAPTVDDIINNTGGIRDDLLARITGSVGGSAGGALTASPTNLQQLVTTIENPSAAMGTQAGGAPHAQTLLGPSQEFYEPRQQEFPFYPDRTPGAGAGGFSRVKEEKKAIGEVGTDLIDTLERSFKALEEATGTKSSDTIYNLLTGKQVEKLAKRVVRREARDTGRSEKDIIAEQVASFQARGGRPPHLIGTLPIDPSKITQADLNRLGFGGK